MKKYIIFLLVIINMLITFSVNAETIEPGTPYGSYDDAVKTVQEVIKAYYLRGRNIQYNNPRAKWKGIAPEEATKQESIYNVCSGFVYDVYSNAFGTSYNNGGFPRYVSSINTVAQKDIDKLSILYYYKDDDGNLHKHLAGKKVGEDFTFDEVIAAMEPGDIIVDDGHAEIVYKKVDTDGDNNIDNVLLFHISGDSYVFHSMRFLDGDEKINYMASKSITPNFINEEFTEGEKFIEGGIMTKLLSDSHKDENGKFICNKKHTCAIIRPFYKDENNNAIFNFSIDSEQYNSSKIRTEYPGLYIEKTVNKQDNNSVYLDSVIEYTITIQNRSNVINGEGIDYKQDLYIEEEVDDKITLKKIPGWTKIEEHKYYQNVGRLKAGQTVTLTYKGRVKDDISYINETIKSLGHYGDSLNSLLISTGTVENKIIPKGKEFNSDDSECSTMENCYNSLKSSHNGLDLIDEIYKKMYGKSLDEIYSDGNEKSFTNFKFENIFLLNEVKKSDTSKTDIIVFKENNFSKKIRSTILNDYWNIILKVTENDGKPLKGTDVMLLPRFLGTGIRKETINEKDFKDGDILIYYTSKYTKDDNTLEENGLYAYIYIDGLGFVGKNLGADVQIETDDRNEFKSSYYDTQKYGKFNGNDTDPSIYLYYKRGNYPAIESVPEEIKNEVLEFVNYQSLYAKDYYVILRPSLESANQTYTINYYQGNGTSTEGNTLIGTSECKYIYDSNNCTLKTYDELGATFPNATNGWNFSGWSTTNTGTEITYIDGETITYNMENDLNLYAVGERTFKFSSGEKPTAEPLEVKQYWNPYSTSTNYVTGVDIPKQTDIPGWEFIGYRGNDGVTSNVGIGFEYAGTNTKLSPDNYTRFYFRSIYSRNVTLTYDANGGSGNIDSQTELQYYNSGYGNGSINIKETISEVTFSLADNQFNNGDNVFMGWLINGNTYQEGYVYNVNFGVEDSAEIQAKAIWSSSILNPIFNLVGLVIDSNKHIFSIIEPKTNLSKLFNTTENNDNLEIYSSTNDLIYSKIIENNLYISTGQYVKYLNSNGEIEIYKLSVKGDVNGDGEISPIDYVKIKNHIMEVKDKMIIGDEYLSAADMSCDGEISPLDYVKVRNYIVPPKS